MRVTGFVKKIKQMAFGILFVSLFAGLSLAHVRAEGRTVILQSILKGENICLFLNGPQAYENVTGQIGREPVEIINAAEDVSGHTIILIDNSLSVTKDNFAKSKEILRQFLEKKPEDEKISLAVYGIDIQYLTERETDAAKVLEVLEGITSEDKDTYLTDVLYDELQKLEDKTEYTRFIIVTDGVDNKEIGYTKEELSAYLEKNAYPIYSIGCRYKDNDEQLKSLFALSRATNAGCYLLDDYEEYDAIVEELCAPVICVEIKAPEELMDGSARNLLLTFEGTGGTEEVSAEIPMPFGLREEPEPVEEEEPEEAEPEEKEEPEETLASEVEAEPAAVQSPEPVPEPEDASIDFVSVGAAIVIIAALAALVIVNVRKKKKDSSETVKEDVPPAVDMSSTVIGEPVEEDGATVFLGDGERADCIVVLRDNGDPAKVFRYPLADTVVVGRKMNDGVNIVLNYESTVSAKHCEISKRGGRFYIRDLHSSNKTFLNGRQVGDYVEFTSGSTLRIGNLTMTIEIERVRQ